jgi:hypothetical protein
MSDASRSATTALGWHAGIALDVCVLGTPLIVVAAPDDDEIARRTSERLFPITDPWLLRCHADLSPEFLTRPSPVSLLGALAWRQGWPAARNAASTFTAFGPRAVLLPPRACRPVVMAEAAVTGMGIVRWDGAAAAVLAAPGPPPGGTRTPVHRLVEETVWAALAASAGDLVLAPNAAAV